MEKRRFCLVLLATALVFGMTVVGCDDGSSSSSGTILVGTNVLDLWNLKTADPDSSTLTKYNLTSSTTLYNQIKNAAGGGFLGWAIDDEDDMVIAWKDRSVSNFNSVADALDTIFNEYDRDNVSGWYYAEGSDYDLNFFSVSDYLDDDIYATAGTMWVYFYE